MDSNLAGHKNAFWKEFLIENQLKNYVSEIEALSLRSKKLLVLVVNSRLHLTAASGPSRFKI